MSSDCLMVSSEDLSTAWVSAFRHVVLARGREVGSLLVRIRGFHENKPVETPEIRAALDAALATSRKHLAETTAATLFPRSMWVPERPADDLYNRYRQLLPRLKKRSRENMYGTYFGRLIAFGIDRPKAERPEPVNQLARVIENYRLCAQRGANPRRSALQAVIFDPFQDHTFQTRRGFPCLQQVTFFWTETQGLRVTGVYATQDIFARAYGNYLGLSRLGRFVAHETGRTLEEVQCFAGIPQCADLTKSRARALLAQLEGFVTSEMPAVVAGPVQGSQP